MAIAFARSSVHTRTKGHSAVAGAAYRAGVILFDERTGETHNYKNRSDVLHSEIMLPDGASEMYKDREFLWNQAEKSSKRKDAQVAKDIVIALPKELPLDKQIELAKNFSNLHFVRHGLVADIAIHNHKDGNPHAHIYVTTRRLKGNQFDSKTARDLNPKFFNGKIVEQDYWGEEWKVFQNKYFTKENLDLRVDENYLLAHRHEGRIRGIARHYIKEENQLKREAAIEIMQQTPEAVIAHLCKDQATFRECDLKRFIGKHTTNQSEVADIVEKVKNHASLVKNPDQRQGEREPIYTIRENQEPVIRVDLDALNVMNSAEEVVDTTPNRDGDVRQESAVVDATIAPHAVLTLDHPGNILLQISSQHAVFSDYDINRAVALNTQSADDFQRAMLKLKEHPYLICLGYGEDGRLAYTTRENYIREADMKDHANTLLTRHEHRVDGAKVRQAIRLQIKQKTPLSQEQKEALYHLATSSDICAVVGRAGTGKSRLMKPAHEMWRSQGYRVRGMAVAGVAAKSLTRESGIKAYTIASVKRQIMLGSFNAGKNDVLVIDEAGMVSQTDMAVMVDYSKRCGAKLVLVGDHGQLQPVGRGAPFRALLERIGFAELGEIRRQEDKRDRVASRQLSKGNVEFALKHYQNKEQLQFGDNADDAMALLLNNWGVTLNKNNINDRLILAHRNEDINRLNIMAREQMRVHGLLGKNNIIVHTAKGKRAIAKGDRIIFLKNDRNMMVSNGEFATIIKASKKELVGVLDSGKEVTIDHKSYTDFDYGYAATVHKSQGLTINDVFGYFGGKGWNRHLAYVLMTRHRKGLFMYADAEEHSNFEELSKALGRNEFKDNVLDFPLEYGARRGFDSNDLAQRLVTKVTGVKETLKDKWLFISNYHAWSLQRDSKMQMNGTQERRNRARLVAKYADLNREIGEAWAGFSNDTRDSTFYQSDAYRTVYRKTLKRNALASEIQKAPDRFGIALERNRVNLDKLKTASETHYRYLNIKSYVKLYQQDNLSDQDQHEREKLASNIQGDILKHYRGLGYLAERKGTTLKALNQQIKLDSAANRYREFANGLSDLEKADFALVRKYYEADKTIRRKWALIYEQGGLDEVNQSVKTELLKITAYRDKQAHLLMNDGVRYEHGFNFYQVNQDRLSKASVEHITREKIRSYQIAAQMDNASERDRLSYELLSDRRYYRMIYAANIDWQKLQNQKVDYEYSEFAKSVASDEKRACALAYMYYQSERKLKKMWREVHQAGGIKEVDQARLQAIKEVGVEADQHATDLMAEKHTENALTFFGFLQAGGVEEAVMRQHYRVKIKAHENANASGDDIERDKISQELLSSREHYRLIHDANLDWKALYRESHAHKHRETLKTLNGDERSAYLLVRNYTQARIHAGMAWSKYFERKKSNLDYKGELTYAKRTGDDRDQLAYHIAINSEACIPFVEKTRVPVQAIEDHAERFIKAHAKQKQSLSPQPRERSYIIKENGYDAKTVNAALSDMGESFFDQVLGENGRKQGKQLRYGSKGSFVATIDGNRKGLWKSFESDAKGNPLSLLMDSDHGWGLSFKDALKAGADIARVSPNQEMTLAPKRDSLDISQQSAKEAKAIADKIARARYYFNSAKPVVGTLAEKYLRKVRELKTMDLSCFRYHPRMRDDKAVIDQNGKSVLDANGKPKYITSYHPAVIVGARNQQGELTAIQATLLDPKTAHKVSADHVGAVKRTRGVRVGSAVQLQQGETANSHIIIAEADITAASLIEAGIDGHIYVTLGNIANAGDLGWLADKHKTKDFYFAADNDGGIDTPSYKAIIKAAQKLHDTKGIRSQVAMPICLNREKTDYNDVLLDHGIDTVRHQASQFKPIGIKPTLAIEAMDKQTIHGKMSGQIDNWKRLEIHKDDPLIANLIESKQRMDQSEDIRQKSNYERMLQKQAMLICYNGDALAKIAYLSPELLEEVRSVSRQGVKQHGAEWENNIAMESKRLKWQPLFDRSEKWRKLSALDDQQEIRDVLDAKVRLDKAPNEVSKNEADKDYREKVTKMIHNPVIYIALKNEAYELHDEFDYMVYKEPEDKLKQAELWKQQQREQPIASEFSDKPDLATEQEGIDWDAQITQKEMKTLDPNKDENIKYLVTFYNLYTNTKDIEKKPGYEKNMNELVADIASSQKLYNELKDTTPTLMKYGKEEAIRVEKSRSRGRSYKG